MKQIILLLTFLITSCSLNGNGLIYGNPFRLTDADVESLLAESQVVYVSTHQLAGFCPHLAAQTRNAGLRLADCVRFYPVRVYISKEQSDYDIQSARRHAASHIYHVRFRGATPEQSARHEGW